jgi:hypothetical protein
LAEVLLLLGASHSRRIGSDQHPTPVTRAGGD